MKAKEFLSQRQVPYVEKNVQRDRQAAMEMIRLSGQQGVPVIAVDNQVIVGFDRRRLEQILAQRPAAGAAKKPSLGVSVGDAAAMVLRRPGLPGQGAYVGAVRSDGPAAQAGIHAGDVIVTIDGRPVQDAAGLEAALEQLQGDGPIRLEYQRDSEKRAVEIRL